MEFLMPIEKEETEKTTVWNDHIPIVQFGNDIDVYIMVEIVDPIEYTELCHLLRNANSKQVIRLHINTPGGSLSSATMIIDAINASEAYIIGVLSGNVASAGTMITMACDEIECSSSLEFMIHYFSGGTAGKGNEIKAHSAFTEKYMPKLFHKTYSGFLTIEEIDSVIDGKDFWMDGDEVVSRWANKELA